MHIIFEILLVWLAFIVLTIAFFRGATLGAARPADQPAARPSTTVRLATARPATARPAKKIVRLIG